jgi:hypothetical protein
MDMITELFILTRLKGGEFILYCIAPKQEDLEALHQKGIPVIEMETEKHG